MADRKIGLYVPRGLIYWRFGKSLLNLIRIWTSTRLNAGSSVDAFAKKLEDYLGSDSVLLASRARTAFKAILLARNVKEGDVVGLPPITIRPLLEVVVGLGLKPVFYDINPTTTAPSRESLMQVISRKPKVMLISPLFGLSDDYGWIAHELREEGIVSVIDCSQTLDSRYQGFPLWKNFDYCIASFSALKTIDTLGGGLLFSPKGHSLNKEQAWIDSLPRASRKTLSFFALRNLFYAAYSLPGILAVLVTLFRTVDFFFPGWVIRQSGTRSKQIRFNLPSTEFRKYSDFQAVLGMQTLSRAKKHVSQRVKTSHLLRSAINARASEFRAPELPSGAEPDFWQLLVYVDSPIDAQRRLWAQGIDTGATSLSFIACIVDSNLQSDFPNASTLYFQTIFLPNHPFLHGWQVARVLRAV